MVENMVVVWGIVALICIASEVGHPGLFYYLSFALGAVCASLAAHYQVTFISQLFIFFVAVAVMVYLLRPVAKKFQNNDGRDKTNVDALLGMRGVVVEAIMPHAQGAVHVAGTVWTALAQDAGMHLTPGTEIVVVRVHGTRLVVAKCTEK